MQYFERFFLKNRVKWLCVDIWDIQKNLMKKT